MNFKIFLTIWMTALIVVDAGKPLYFPIVQWNSPLQICGSRLTDFVLLICRNKNNDATMSSLFNFISFLNIKKNIYYNHTFYILIFVSLGYSNLIILLFWKHRSWDVISFIVHTIKVSYIYMKFLINYYEINFINL